MQAAKWPEEERRRQIPPVTMQAAKWPEEERRRQIPPVTMQAAKWPEVGAVLPESARQRHRL
jgi:hypothetical protein